MNVLVVYESMFGSTSTIAEAIGRGVAAEGAEVEVRPLHAVAPEDLDVDLLVVGAPTHLRGLSNIATRGIARYSGNHPPTTAVPETRRGLRRWLRRSAPGSGRAAAAFDTAVDDPGAGSAARSIARRLRRRGWRVVAPPMSFRVHGVDGGLRVFERQRAQAWGAEIAGATRDALTRGARPTDLPPATASPTPS